MAAVTKERAWKLRQEFRTQTEMRRLWDYADECRAKADALEALKPQPPFMGSVSDALVAECLDGWSMLPALVVEKLAKREEKA